MIRSSFDIGQSSTDATAFPEARLLLWISSNWFAAAWFQGSGDTLTRLVTYPLSESADTGLAEQVQAIFSREPMLGMPVHSSAVIYQFEEAQLVPQSSITEEGRQELLELLSGTLRPGAVYSEAHPSQALQNVYRIPQILDIFFQQKFPQVRHQHLYSILLKQLEPTADAGAYLLTLFFPEKMVVTVMHDGRLQLMQSYPYQAPEDVSWLLLNICQQLALAPSAVSLTVSGFIDIQSATFEEMAKYFSDIQLDTADSTRWPTEVLAGYPAHYFAPILKASLCV